MIVTADEGVRPVALDEIRDLRPAAHSGLHTFATKTHPAEQGVVRLLPTAFARVDKTHMPQAPVPAALADAGLTIGQIDAVTTHNPFAVNDTGLRSIAELIEELRQRGRGIGLFTGRAAGDTGAAVVIEVTD